MGNRKAAKVVTRISNQPTAPVDAPGITGYEHLIRNAAEAASTRYNNNRRNS
jgi:hypothetical protein